MSLSSRGSPVGQCRGRLLPERQPADLLDAVVMMNRTRLSFCTPPSHTRLATSPLMVRIGRWPISPPPGVRSAAVKFLSAVMCSRRVGQTRCARDGLGRGQLTARLTRSATEGVGRQLLRSFQLSSHCSFDKSSEYRSWRSICRKILTIRWKR